MTYWYIAHENARVPSMKKQVNITIWGIVSLAVFMLLANIALGIALMTQSQNAMKSIIDERMLDLSNTAAALVDGDALNRITADDKDTPEYRAIYDTLLKFETNIELEYIYTLRQADDGSFYFVIDPSLTNPSEYGEIATTTNGLLSASRGTATVDQEPYTDNYGRFYSAYSPVYTSDGRIAGVVAADFDADWYDSRVGESMWTVVIGSLITLLLGGLILFLFTRRMRKRFGVLTDELNDLSDAIDDFTREITNESGSALPQDDQQRSSDMILDLEERVKTTRANLSAYLDTMHSQANSMITALSSDYRSVYYINLDDDEGVCYQAHTIIGDSPSVGESFPYLSTFRNYAEKHVTEDTREDFLSFIDPDSIRKNLETNQVISCLYLIKHDGRESYEMLRMAGVRRAEDRDDHIVHAVGAGFTNVDAETRNAMAKNQALSDALVAAEEANRAKTVFLSNMSHEIRAPMNAIIGLDHIALNEPGISDKTRENLVKIGESADHLLALINDILDMSRIESGRMSIHNEDFHLMDALSQVNIIIEGQCRDKGLNYHFDMQGEADGFYRGDETKLRQVLINILGNAVKFTPVGGDVNFTVQRTAHFENKSTIRFISKDSGIGMGEEFLSKIFDPFSQEDSLRASKYGSTGLGMPITKSIVEMMNGTIQVESEKDTGTTFYVTITFTDSDQADLEVDGVSLHDLHVLVVSGDDISAKHAALELEGAGIEAAVAQSSDEAVDMAKLQDARGLPYNLVLLDSDALEADGIEAVRRLRPILGDSAVIIILTTRQWGAIAEKALDAGVDDFLMKPLSGPIAAARLKKALQRKAREEQGQSARAQLEGRRVLIAEDIEANAEILMDILELREVMAEHAENGMIAVEMFSEHPEGYFDAILMDMRMPVMDGLQATATIRALDRPDAQTIPIIAFTANAFDEDVQNSLQAGMNAHLSKPIDPDILFDTLERLIHD